MLKIADKKADHYLVEADNCKKKALAWFKDYKESGEKWMLGKAKSYLQSYNMSLQSLKLHLEQYPPVPPEDVVGLFETYFPGQYDIVENNVIIHFPSITVTDSNGATWEITDLYFKFTFNGYNPREHISLYARRMSATPEEIFTGYAHSHVSGSALINWDSAICFGHEFTWKRDGFLDSIEFLLVHLRGFLETESSFTSPYSLLSKIGFFSGLYEDHQYELKGINEMPFDLEIENFNGLTVFKAVDNHKLDSYLIDMYPEAVAYRKGEDYYRKYSTEVSTSAVSNSSIFFRGEKINFTVLPTRAIPPQKELNLHFKKYFIENSKYEITKRLAAFAATNSEPAIADLGELVQEDTVPVQQD